MPEIFGPLGIVWVSLALVLLFMVAWRIRSSSFYLWFAGAFVGDVMGSLGSTYGLPWLWRGGRILFVLLAIGGAVMIFVNKRRQTDTAGPTEGR